MFDYFILVYSLFSIVALSRGQSSSNIVFDLADLTVDFDSELGSVSLEAFKSSLNDVILEKNEPTKFGQLSWLSIGNPELTRSQVTSSTSTSSLFVFRPEGFYVKCHTLTDSHRALFQDVVYRKYGVNVTKSQIVNLVPARFECSILFYDNQIKYIVNGKASRLGVTPLKIDFSAPIGSPERNAFERRVRADGEELNIEIKCDIHSQGKSYRQNTLIITGN